MKVGLISNLVVLIAKCLRVFGVVGFVVLVFLFERGMVFDPKIQPLSEKQVRFVALEAMRKYGWEGEIEIIRTRYDEERWLVFVTRIPCPIPTGLGCVAVGNDYEPKIEICRE